MSISCTSPLQLDTYEILVGDATAVKWVNVDGPFDVGSLGAIPVKGGKENNETPLFIAQAPYGNTNPIDVHPGKIGEGLDGECRSTSWMMCAQYRV